MFDSLSDKLESVFKKLRGQGVMTEDNIKEALREVRLALLEADVNFKVVKDFVENVRLKGCRHTRFLPACRPASRSSGLSTMNWFPSWAAARIIHSTWLQNRR